MIRGRAVEVRQDDRRPLVLLVQGPLEVGRECDGLLLADNEVSRRHAQLDLVAGEVRIDDLASTNGTFVNGDRITGPAVLRPGDVARLGSTEIQVVDDQEPVTTTAGADDVKQTVVRSRGTVLAAAPEPPAAAAATALKAAVPADADPRATSILKVAAAVQEERQDPPKTAVDGDTVTIVFSDIESSTEQALALGDARWFEVLGTHNRIVRQNLRGFGGHEIKSQGDGFMLTFQSARRAVQFCVSVQQALATWSLQNPEDAVRIRIGAHTGEAIVDDDGDLFGKHIIIAARIANLADGAEILVSNVVREITESRGDLRYGETRMVTLKGLAGEHPVHEVLWTD